MIWGLFYIGGLIVGLGWGAGISGAGHVEVFMDLLCGLVDVLDLEM